jgi:MFS family permease
MITDDRPAENDCGKRGRVSATLGAVINAASVASLAAGGVLAAVLNPRQVYLLAGVLGGVVTLWMAGAPGAAARHRPRSPRYFVRR